MNFLAAVKIGDSVQQGLDEFFAFLPRLLGFLLILAIGYIVAKRRQGHRHQGARARRPRQGPAHRFNRPVRQPGRARREAAPDDRRDRVLVHLPGRDLDRRLAARHRRADDFVASIAAYLPNVVAAILIFVVAGAIAAAVGGLVARTMGDTPTGKVVGSVVPVLVMAIATFMILNQLQIATEIVTITYAALIGGVFLAMALAFGLGGRAVAQRMLEDAYDKGQEQQGPGQGRHGDRQGARRAGRRARQGRGAAAHRHRRRQRRDRAAPARSGTLMATAATSRRAPDPVRDDAARPQRDEFGGLNWGAAFFGWLVAVGVAALLTAILSAAGAAVGLTKTSSSQATDSADTIGIVGGVLFLLVLLVAYFAGGYVAGRMSRFDGPRQGCGVWLIGLLVTVVLAVAGVLLGAEYNVLVAAEPPAHPHRRGLAHHGRADRPRRSRARNPARRRRRRQGRARVTTARSTEWEDTHDHAGRDRMEGPGAPRPRRREDRHDRGDLPRHRDRPARVGARQDRAVRHQGHLRAAAAGQPDG